MCVARNAVDFLLNAKAEVKGLKIDFVATENRGKERIMLRVNMYLQHTALPRLVGCLA